MAVVSHEKYIEMDVFNEEELILKNFFIERWGKKHSQE